MSTFRIATWNTQGNSFANGKLASLVYKCAPDIICLQECGNLFDIIKFEKVVCDIYRGQTQIGRKKIYDVFYYPWSGGNKRCSLATLISRGKFIPIPEDELGPEDEKLDELPVKVYSTTFKAVETRNSRGDVLRTRPMLRTNVYMESDNRDQPIDVSINNMHLISGNKQYALSMFDQFFRVCSGNFIMIGDMNIPPDQMFKQYRYNLYFPRLLTQQRGNILDFMYSSLKSRLVESASYFADSDHRPVVYDITIE